MADIANGVQKMMVLLSEYTMTDANTIVKLVNEKLSKMASPPTAPTTDTAPSGTKRAPTRAGRR